MSSIYQDVYAAVSQGARYSINLKERTLKVDGKKVIDKGEYEGVLGLVWDWDYLRPIDFLIMLEILYARYKHSVPSERSDSRKSTYFKALREHELNDEDALFGGQREVAMFDLEFTLLAGILDGFRWDEASMGKWFWQSSADKDFVILREWIQGV